MRDLRVCADRAFCAADKQKKLAEKVNMHTLLQYNFMHRLKINGWEMGMKGLR